MSSCKRLQPIATQVLELVRSTTPSSIDFELKVFKRQFDDDYTKTHRFHDVVHVLQALRILPMKHRMKRSTQRRSLREYATVLYRYLHNNPGPYAVKELSEKLNIQRRRAYEVFGVLKVMGLVYNNNRYYISVTRLSPTALYWWNALCDKWGVGHRDIKVSGSQTQGAHTLETPLEEPEAVVPKEYPSMDTGKGLAIVLDLTPYWQQQQHPQATPEWIVTVDMKNQVVQVYRFDRSYSQTECETSDTCKQQAVSYKRAKCERQEVCDAREDKMQACDRIRFDDTMNTGDLEHQDQQPDTNAGDMLEMYSGFTLDEGYYQDNTVYRSDTQQELLEAMEIEQWFSN